MRCVQADEIEYVRTGPWQDLGGFHRLALFTSKVTR